MFYNGSIIISSKKVMIGSMHTHTMDGISKIKCSTGQVIAAALHWEGYFCLINV